MKRVFRVKIKVRNCNEVFKEGLEPGVLAFNDIVFDLKKKDYESPMFTKALIDEKNKLLSEIIIPEIQELEEG